MDGGRKILALGLALSFDLHAEISVGVVTKW